MLDRFKVETQGINTFLCYSLRKEEELDEFDYGMMRNNSIKGLMPVVFSEVDVERIIKYNITSKVTLERFLDGEISRNHFILILKNLQEAFVNLKEYMLSTDHLFLEYSHIFVDMNKMNIYMVYLPVQFDQEKKDFKQFFRDLIFRVRYRKDEDIRYIIELVNYLNLQPIFSLEKFGKILNDIQEENTGINSDKKEIKLKTESSRQQFLEKKLDQDQNDDGLAVTDEEEDSNKKRNFFRPKEDKETERKQRKTAKNKKTSKGSAAGFRIPGMEVPVSEEFDDSEDLEEKAESTDKKKRVFSLFGGRKKEDAEPAEQGDGNSQHEERKKNSSSYFEQEYEIDEEGRLVINKKQFGSEYQQSPYLVRIKTGEKIMLNDSVLKIGRNRKYVDYCIENNSTIGRSHADIIKTPEGYKIIDNNSKNHTYVENAIVQSDEPVVLKHGDRIVLSDEEFKFYMY